MTDHCCNKRDCCLALGTLALIGAASTAIKSIFFLVSWDWSLATDDVEIYTLEILFWSCVASAILSLCLTVVSSVYIYAVDQKRPRLMIPFLTWMILAVIVVLILLVLSLTMFPMPLTAILGTILGIAATIKALLCWLVYAHMKETMKASAWDWKMPLVADA